MFNLRFTGDPESAFRLVVGEAVRNDLRVVGAFMLISVQVF